MTIAVAKMAKAPSRDSSPDLCTQFSTLTLVERELKARNEIEALELEERIATLETKRDLMKCRNEERLQ